MILCETHSPGYAMLMRSNKAETAVPGCHHWGDRLCACMRSWPDRGMCFVTSLYILCFFYFIEVTNDR